MDNMGANSLFMATTRAATFSAKIRTLSEFHSRILSIQQPSTAEIVTTLRYFQQTLIGFLKDIPSENSSLFEKFNNDLHRSNYFPNLSYSGLFYGIINLLDAFPLLTSGQSIIGEAILDTFKTLYFFLDRDCIDQMAYVIASQLNILPIELNKKIVRLLCECILPYSLSDSSLIGLSIPAVLMLILQHSKDSSLHTMIVECLMIHRENVYNDLLAVIAKGTSESRIPAANLLFHYWPLMNPTVLHRKSIQYKIQTWSLPPCQNNNCVEKGPSIKRLFDPFACAKYGDTSPPISLCKICINVVETKCLMPFIIQPMPATNITACQNKECKTQNQIAIGTCFAEDCIRLHNYLPLRLCQDCFVFLHSSEKTMSHIRHKGAACVWGTSIERNMVEAVVKLLKETSSQLEGNESEGKRPKWLRQLEGGQILGKDIDALSDERRMLSRFGIWMMAALCPPTEEAPTYAIGYIMSIVFQWFSTTALLPNDSMGVAIEQLKTDFALNWVNLAVANHYNIFIAVLKPDLPEFAQIGGVWDKFCSRKEQLKEGLSKLLSLMPYDVISFDTWLDVIPEWLQAISNNIDEDNLKDLKVLLCKIFEPDLCPLPFEQNQVFEFVSKRLNSTVYQDILNSLDWLHLLSRLNIRIPLLMILKMFLNGLKQLHTIIIPNNEENDFEENLGPLATEIIMVDIIAQQVILNEIKSHDAESVVIKKMFDAFAQLLQYSQNEYNEHTCQNPETDQFSDCIPCQQAGFLYQVLMHLIKQLCSKEEQKIDRNMTAAQMNDWLIETQMSDLVVKTSQETSSL